MHSDIHLQLHALTAAELHRESAADHAHAAPRPAASTALRVRLGWVLVELGLRLATPVDRSRPLAA
ncbi:MULTISPECIES: hypothetical protein [unclassified Streptomyces]|uniref:hypothetical protein n=1 Tax=unclassified Streptomyces TaxID=2593676 RepID=UPI0016604CC9|nr:MULTISPECIES: hypothetical protein [unclassified Streptomyces]MBD0708144.1 hypothetical protein [Streptomyces sp. CBMA291]MBD0715771.1 hypothetical protein [Streptomyces sp. CBMA370]